MKKSLIAILMTTVILLSLAVPLISILPVKAEDPSDWYMTVNGVLDSDYYVLYPYENDASLNIGFSKFGELINSDENVGMEYAEVDPYAYPVGADISDTVPKRMWVQGWLMNITYTHRTLGERNVWATAIHADSVAYGNDWIRVDYDNDWSTMYGYEDPRDPGYLIYGTGTYGSALTYGGRKTNGTAVTDDIEVLYNGPREFIAVCRTTIYDHLVFESNSTESDVALVQLAITIRFDKVKKDVVLLKDVKSLLVEKEGISMKIQFSNRGEVDLGTEEVGISSYMHFYTEGTTGAESVDPVAEGLDTVYDRDWELFQTTDFGDDSAAGGYPQTSGATYDVAQAINPDASYVWTAAFWPSLSDWSIDGWDAWWHSLTINDPHYIDAAGAEPDIPFYIGEWDFRLYHTLDAQGRTQFRGVTQYAVTDWHDADDEDMAKGSNVIDSEMLYYLDETFNPWDLEAAVHKDTRRWLEWKTAGATSFTTLASRVPVIDVDDDVWDDYCVFSERVVSMSTGKLLVRGVDYDFSVSSTTGRAKFTGKTSAFNNAKCKILYSTTPYWGDGDLVPLTNYTVTVEGYTNGTEVTFTYDDAYEAATDPLGVTHSFDFDVSMAYIFDLDPAANFTGTINAPCLDDVKYDFGVSFETDFEQNFYYWDNVTYANDYAQVTCISQDPTNLNWYIESANEDVWMDVLDLRLYLAAFVNYTVVDDDEGPENLTITFMPYMGYSYSEHMMGTYEWTTVGRDSETVDSAGSALVSEAFDSLKHIGVGIAGADMAAEDVVNQMPWVMADFGAGTSVSDYKDDILRAALRDDYCTYWPVASSNMLGTGGPLANLLAYYANDFTDALYGLTEFAGTAYSGAIAGVTCWNRNWDEAGYNTYTSSNTTGYAVITTYKDINGTVIFEVWGHWGRDTYYATQWLHGDVARGIPAGIVQLQDAPGGLTSIIIKISYGTDPLHPSFSIVECLGTISETRWIHTSSNSIWDDWVYSSGEPVTTSVTLESGKTYRIDVAECFWYDYPNSLEADAMYYTTESIGWNWANHFPAPDGHSFLQINGADINWGAYNGDHAYSIEYVGQGTSITFQIIDWVDQDYTNNICHLPIYIYITEYKGGIHDP